MYTVAQISTIVEKSKSTIIYHIDKGYLKASRGNNLKGIDSAYKITQDDLDDYLQNYIYSDKKRDNVAYNGGKKLNLAEFTKLTDFIDFIKKTESIEDVIKKYEKLELKFPSLEAYILHNRNKSLTTDYEENIPIPQLMETYNLSIGRIYVILKKQREF